MMHDIELQDDCGEAWLEGEENPRRRGVIKYDYSFAVAQSRSPLSRKPWLGVSLLPIFNVHDRIAAFRRWQLSCVSIADKTDFQNQRRRFVILRSRLHTEKIDTGCWVFMAPSIACTLPWSAGPASSHVRTSAGSTPTRRLHKYVL